MNAYELAEIVDKWAYSESAEYLTDAANMLRQQTDRIAELEKRIEELKEVNGRFAELIQMQREHTEELRQKLKERHGIK